MRSRPLVRMGHTVHGRKSADAGTVITLTNSDFGGSGVDFDFVAGEAVYIYQGSNAATPTSFLYALEAGDGNTTFNASLANTGLSVGNGTAAAIAFDNRTYAGPTTYAGSFLFNGASQTLLKSISDPNNWRAPTRPVKTLSSSMFRRGRGC